MHAPKFVILLPPSQFFRTGQPSKADKQGRISMREKAKDQTYAQLVRVFSFLEHNF